MKSMMFLAAALAAIAAPLSAAAPAAAQDVALHDHIRTTLYGDTGHVVVLIPGMSTPDEVWDDTVAALRDTHRLLTVEVRGFDGERGTANEAEGALDGIVADLAADLAVRGLEPATIVGHSLGGLVAAQFGLDHDAQAKNLLILDSLPFFGTVFGADQTLETIGPRADSMRDMIIAQADAMRAMGEQGTTSGDGATGMSVDEATRVTIANWSLKAEPLVVARLVHEDMMRDLRQEVASLKMPVTVIHFAEEPMAQMAVERYATDWAAVPNVRMVPVDDSRHFVQLDRPDVFLAELKALSGD